MKAAQAFPESILIGNAVSIENAQLRTSVTPDIESHMTNVFEWDGDWESVSIGDAAWAEEELRRELAPGHVLFDQSWAALGRRWRRDDFLFRLADGRFAQVHLTRHVETDPRWPAAGIFESFEDWKAVPPEDR